MPFVVLACSVLAVSTGAIFVRLADAPPLVIAAYRMGLAFAIILPYAIAHCGAELRQLSRRQVCFALVSGGFLAAHFATWISSLSHTSIANSTVLVNTIPLWVGLLTPFLTRDRVNRWLGWSIVLSVAGGAAIGAADFSATGDDLWGDALALLGGFCAAIYLLIGRNLRRELSLPAYATICYGCAAGTLIVLVLTAGLPVTGFNTTTYWAFIGMAIVSQVFGHTAYNWSLRWISAGLIAISLLGEPLLCTLWAFLLFEESLTWLQSAGGLLILAGIAIAAFGETRRSPPCEA
jgi:drug/metabolite transporter (DMT)-like permease